MSRPTHKVILGDALEVLPTLGSTFDVFTGIPDAAEVGDGSVEEWRPFFRTAVRECIRRVNPDNGVAVFYQTDRRYNGALEPKSFMVIEEAVALGFRVLWHKVAVGGLGTNLFRPNFSHIVAVGAPNATSGKAFPDVIQQGPKVYPNAIDNASLPLLADFLKRRGTTSVLDPFCGYGTIASICASRGMSTVSIDIDPDQVARTRKALGVGFTGDADTSHQKEIP